ncbi:unnamed protein product, partial [Ectocarpus sp. 12 AP-2014]
GAPFAAAKKGFRPDLPRRRGCGRALADVAGTETGRGAERELPAGRPEFYSPETPEAAEVVCGTIRPSSPFFELWRPKRHTPPACVAALRTHPTILFHTTKLPWLELFKRIRP